jgi:hypothetical protein
MASRLGSLGLLQPLRNDALVRPRFLMMRCLTQLKIRWVTEDGRGLQISRRTPGRQGNRDEGPRAGGGGRSNRHAIRNRFGLPVGLAFFANDVKFPQSVVIHIFTALA